MHPMIRAALNSSDPEWRRYFLFCDDLDWTEPIEDTSERGPSSEKEGLEQ
jgi:hypothetical protein